jgi:hypothetical protein
VLTSITDTPASGPGDVAAEPVNSSLTLSPKPSASAEDCLGPYFATDKLTVIGRLLKSIPPPGVNARVSALLTRRTSRIKRKYSGD